MTARLSLSALTFGAALALGAALTLGACRNDSQPDAPPPVRPVLSMVAAVRTTDTMGPFAGTIEPRYKTDLGFRIFGRMVARLVDVGQVVTKGQEIASLDPMTQQLAVRSVEATVANAEAQLANVQAEEARQKDLAVRNFTPQAQLDVIQRNLETARANLTRARASLTKAQDALSFTRLDADYDGVITGRYAEPGQVVNPGERIVTLARPEVREAVIAVPSALADTLERPNDLTISVDLDHALSIKATGVRGVDPISDPTTRTRTVFLSLDDPPPVFRLGITVSVTIARPVSPRIDLPATAILDKDGKSFVWLVDPTKKTVSLHEVTVASRDGSQEGDQVDVTAGLSGGERVVIAGVHSLTPDQLVSVPP
jgi:RND family efflux transporter MFP subunit